MQLCEAIDAAISNVPEILRREAAMRVFLALRHLFLNCLFQQYDATDDLSALPVAHTHRLIYCAAEDQSEHPEKRLKTSDTRNMVDPAHKDYCRQTHIQKVMEDWQLGIGFGDDDDHGDVEQPLRLFQELANSQFQAVRNRQLQASEPLPVAQIVKVVEFFASTFGHAGRDQLSRLLSALKRRGRTPDTRVWASTCRLEAGVVCQQKQDQVSSSLEEAGTEDNSAASGTSTTVPDAVKLFFRRIRQYLETTSQVDRITEIVRLDKRVSVLSFYWQARLLIQGDPPKISEIEQRHRTELVTYVSNSKGRNPVEKLNNRLAQDFHERGVDAASDKLMLRKFLADLTKGSALYHLRQQFGIGLYALIAGNIANWYVVLKSPNCATATDI